ncbi:MAG: hypothetical protein QOE35_2615 [Actinomycetota bacterium]|jgi:GNAT superfamily N-acetyltransferase
MRVVEVEAARTHALRSRVLRGGVAPEKLTFAGDDVAGTFHLAVEDPTGAVVAVGTFIPTDQGTRLRYMAVDPAVQGSGAGRALLDAAVERLRAAGVTRLWCNARDPAVGFYERLGWTVTGPGFVDDEVDLPHHPMQLLL